MQRFKRALIFGILNLSMVCHARKALVVVPVADVVGEPIKTFGIAPTNKQSYEQIAICGAPTASSTGAPRIHQLLFNETVEILSDEPTTRGDEEEVCITFDGAFFITSSLHKPQHIFWTRKKNLLSFEKLKNKNIGLENIPETPSFKNTGSASPSATIGLIRPFFDPVTRHIYSAGTRFIYDELNSTETHYLASLYDRASSKLKTTLIPKKYAVVLHARDHKESIACFLRLLKSWVSGGDGIIPYVWGGCSYTKRFADEPFSLVAKPLKSKKNVRVYMRNECDSHPCVGFDCSGIILRAAQLCGIPYFFKNTYTLAHYLKSLAVGEHLHEGDLIWIPGHVMIVSDIAQSKLIEARGYSHDFGIVHEIELSKVFKDIKTYKDLLHAFHSRKPLIRLNKRKKPVETITTFKLLKLESVWNHHSY